MSIIYSASRRKFIFSCFTGAIVPYAFAAAPSGRAFETQTNSFESFSFAFISDCHLTSHLADNFVLLQESQLFLQEAIKQINLLKPDFVIFGGDQVQGVGDDDINWQLFLDIAQSLDCSWHFILGEADISGNIPINKMRTFGRDWKGKGLNNAEPYWSCDPIANLHLIGLDTSQANSVTGYIDERQIDWLKQDICRKKSAMSLVVSHHPLLSPGDFYKDTNYLLPQAEAVRQILEKADGLVISISGHTHLSKIQWQNNTWYISSPSLDIYPCAFRLFKISPEEIEVHTYQVNFPALIKKAKTNLLNSSLATSLKSGKSSDFIRLAAGNREDQNAGIVSEGAWQNLCTREGAPYPLIFFYYCVCLGEILAPLAVAIPCSIPLKTRECSGEIICQYAMPANPFGKKRAIWMSSVVSLLIAFS